MKAKNVLNKAMSLLMPLAITAGSFQAQAQQMTMNGHADIAAPISLAPRAIPAVESLARNPGQVARPQQYVLLAFDGSYRDSTWKYLRKFTKDQKAQNSVDVHFTFFLNPVYLLERSLGLQVYHPPHGNHGSAIGWGDNQADIAQRLDNMNGAYAEGHEMGSHAVGHFDGGKWSAAEWNSELTQFFSILDNVFSLNNLRPKNQEGLAFRKNIVGFRAPLLAYSLGLYQTLPQFGIKYDTSQQADGPGYWPEMRRDSGTWNFPLARIAIPGTAKHYPTMDYNFCANDSIELLRSNPDLINYSGPDPMTGKILSNRGKSACLPVLPPEEKEFIKNRTIQAYMAYFNSNYYGDRAPVSIGHHFSPWMSGAYFEAMMYIADTVCKKPEVKCVTYHELMKFMNDKTATGEAAAFRAGAFEHIPRPKAVREEATLDIEAVLVKTGDDLKVVVSGRDAKMKGLTTSLYLDNIALSQTAISMEQIRKMVTAGSNVQLSAVVMNRQGVEVQSATHIINNIGLTTENFNEESLEKSFQRGDLPGAHEGVNAEDFTKGN
jgi:peptidoglycan/xylan/chitin deacetylase (PgdA/CDA1 family)